MSGKKERGCKEGESRPRKDIPQRPRTLLQRLSSGLSSTLPTIAFRRPSSAHKCSRCPEAASDFDSVAVGRKLSSQPHGRKVLSGTETPVLSDGPTACSCDSRTCRSFPSIERLRNDFCGLKSSSRSSMVSRSGRAHNDSRPHSPQVHFGVCQRLSSSDGANNIHLSPYPCDSHTGSSSEEVPRPISHAAAAKKLGNPPRRSSLPIPRLATPSTAPLSSDEGLRTKQSSVYESFSVSTTFTRSRNRSSVVENAKPISPKLHHIHGISGAQKVPYVHRHEVEEHLAALRAGATSPLLQMPDSTSTRVSPTTTDFSETVYYGRGFSSVTARQPTEHRSHRYPRASSATLVRPVVATVTDTTINVANNNHLAAHELELGTSDVYRRRSPEHQRQTQTHDGLSGTPPSEYTSETFDTGTTQFVGGRRLELKGGSQNSPLRLRGGSGEPSSSYGSQASREEAWIQSSFRDDCDDCDDAEWYSKRKNYDEHGFCRRKGQEW
ncbi:hypothetical protein ACN47E_002020 [Coniothyrium glycines]